MPHQVYLGIVGVPGAMVVLEQLRSFGHFDDEARQLRIARLALSVNNPNPAKRLYEALGYRTVTDDGESSVMVLDL